jgi:enterochelin esterase-like enzyme
VRKRAAVALAALVAAAFAPAAHADEIPYDAAPPFLDAPQRQGFALVLTVVAGGWGGKHLTFTYSWHRCDADGAGCAPILGATRVSGLWSDEYVVTGADAGHRLRVLVTATNARGATSRWSNLGPVVPPPAVALGAGRQGTISRYDIFSPVLGRVQEIRVYLPPGYATASQRLRYPALYLLHGFPGSPASFVDGLTVGTAEDELLAEHLMQPVVLVMPAGAADAVTQTSWLDSAVTGRWESFVAGDVVHWVDACFRTNAAPAGRGVAGLSDGGFGALNLGLHRPGEFRLVESWSGYENADPASPPFAGTGRSLLAYDSPAVWLSRVAPALRRAHVFFWMYIGADDAARAENAAFAAALTAARVPHSFQIVPGSHLPSVYRANLPAALRVAGARLSAADGRARRPAPACPAASGP